MKNLILILFFFPLFGLAQTKHTVAAKESLYSIGRQYNIHPRELAEYNNIPLETGLTIGQVIKIPAKTNQPPLTVSPPVVKEEKIAKKATPAADPGQVPIYHKVEKKETLYHISKIYNKGSVDEIKKWNNLTSDAVSEGTNLIVGFQKGKKEQPVAEKQPAQKQKPEISETPVVNETKTVIPKPIVTEKSDGDKITEKPIPVKAETNIGAGKNSEGGYFKNVYNTQTEGNKTSKEETGTASTFKSTSGWQDGKFYCLYNTAPAGSIVKITNKDTQKSIYAKVLDVIPDLKQNAGILILLSNAAASELGAGENNFESIINF